ncbi:MAG: DUF4395 domain-containing protein [Chitinophagaceae bacterium]|nr:MAG: DUF4395 domain-containing protein [Chitinophagaceae bacterium]
MNSTVSCPVDNIKVNEYQVRVTAGLVLVLGIAWVLGPTPWIPVFLIIDFLMRAINYGRFSLLNMISRRIVQLFDLGEKPVDRAPKKFAAMMGCAFSVLILLLYLAGLHSLAMISIAFLLAFAFLESMLAFCAGCFVYQYFFLPKKQG